MRIPPYPCAYCGRSDLPHPLSYEAKCVDCAVAELEQDAAALRWGTRAAIFIAALVLAFVLGLAIRGAP